MEAATTEPQHIRALKKANRLRLAAAAVKRDLATSRIGVAEALADPRAESLELLDLLMAQRRWGRARARRAILAAAAGGDCRVPLFISENRRVGDLTARQRGRIAEAAAPSR